MTMLGWLGATKLGHWLGVLHKTGSLMSSWILKTNAPSCLDDSTTGDEH